MGWRTTTALAVALVVTTLFAWIDLGGESAVSPPSAPEAQVKHLLDFSAEAVQAIRVRQGAFDVRSERQPGGWSGAPRPGMLDDFLVNLQELVEIMPLEVPVDQLNEYGLDAPEGVVELFLRDGQTISLLIGHRNPPATAMYVRLGPDGPAALTGAILDWEIEKVVSALKEAGSQVGRESSG